MAQPLPYLLITVKAIELGESLFMICKVLRLFINTMATDGMYSLLNGDNLRQSIQIQLSQKQKTFSPVFYAFLKSALNLEDFQEKNDPHS